MSGSPLPGRLDRPDRRVALALLALSIAVLFTGLSRYGVVNADEGIYHAIAERMVETGNPFRLNFRGERRVYDTFMNAPLHYWARAGLIATVGSNRFTMRAVSALFGVLAVLVTYALGCRLVGRHAAAAAALVQLTTFQFVYLHGARTGELDTIVTCLVATCCLTFLRGVENGKSFVPHHLTLAALAMTKLPLVILPVAAELCWLVFHPSARRELRRYATTGIALLPLALLWHGGQAFVERDRVGDVWSTMAGQASGDRTATGRPAEGPRLGPIGNARFYAKAMFYGAFPWAVAYPFAIAAAFTRGTRAAGLRTAVLFAATIFAFFVMVTKHYPWYVMPAYPFLSILVGAWLWSLVRRDAPAWSAWGVGAVLASCAWISVDVFGTNPFEKRALVFPMKTIAQAWLGIGPALAIPLLGVAWAALWIGVGRRIPETLRRSLAGSVAALLLVVAVVRVAAPMAYLDYQSPLERIRAKIDHDQRTGTPLEYPITLGRPPVQIARFLFAEDFEIVTQLRRDGTALALRRKGDRRVLDRSIGRVGLEWRFQQARDAKQLEQELEAPLPE